MSSSLAGTRLGRRVSGLPPVTFFLTSAVFHYLGPSLAVLLFVHVEVLGVAWLRIVSAAVVLAIWRRPWRLLARLDGAQRRLLVALGVVLAARNALFYLAVDRLPLSTVGAIEFLGTVVVAAVGVRSGRNLLALLLAVAGVAVLVDVRFAGEPLGFLFAFANCVGFMLYVVLGHRLANQRTAAGGDELSGLDLLAAAMIVAAAAVMPLGLGEAVAAVGHPTWLLWGIGVGICSSVVPYVADQLAMARLPRARFALMLSLLPAFATVIGLVVLGQVPTVRDLAGVLLVVVGVAVHREPVARLPGPTGAGRCAGCRDGWLRRG